jgi:hypothetical protein
MTESKSTQTRLSLSGHIVLGITPRATIIQNNDTSSAYWRKAKNGSGKLLASIAAAWLWLLAIFNGWLSLEALLLAGGTLAFIALVSVILLRRRKHRRALSMRDSALW